jgi:hypothetical protein
MGMGKLYLSTRLKFLFIYFNVIILKITFKKKFTLIYFQIKNTLNIIAGMQLNCF